MRNFISRGLFIIGFLIALSGVCSAQHTAQFLNTEVNGSLDVTANQTTQGINIFPFDASGNAIQVPYPFTPLSHQNQGCTPQLHNVVRNDCNILLESDSHFLRTHDPSLFTEAGIGGASQTAGDQLGFQLTISGVTYNDYVTIPTPSTGWTNTLTANYLAAGLNGGIQSATVQNGGSGITAGSYNLSIEASICPVPPRVTVTVNGSGVVQTAVTAPSNGSSIWGGWCLFNITNPVGIAGTNATLNVNQASVAISAALEAFQDAVGNVSHATAFMLSSTVVSFDMPWGTSNQFAVCGGPGTTGFPGTSCPTATTEIISSQNKGTTTDVGPLFVMQRFGQVGRPPVPGDEIPAVYFEGPLNNAAGLNEYGSIFTTIGGNITKATAPVTSGTSIAVTDTSQCTNGNWVSDLTTIWAISVTSTVVSGCTPGSPGAGSIVISSAVQAGGVLSGDGITFTSATNPQGAVHIGASATANDGATDVQLIVSGCPACTEGAGGQLLHTFNGDNVFGILNDTSGSLVTSTLQVATGTNNGGVAAAFLNLYVQDNSGSPISGLTFGSLVSQFILDGTDASGITYFFRSNGTPMFTLSPIKAQVNTGAVFQIPQVTWTDTQTCSPGQISVDANYIYVCTQGNIVERAALSAF